MIKSKNNIDSSLSKSVSIVMLVMILGLSFYSCEDDALLEPQEEEECTGSYCNLSMPNSKNYIAAYNPRTF
tara:strand:- start:496 stop:708 length:213 start_codon:yes stop_codon:yes gene_type:complete